MIQCNKKICDCLTLQVLFVIDADRMLRFANVNSSAVMGRNSEKCLVRSGYVPMVSILLLLSFSTDIV